MESVRITSNYAGGNIRVIEASNDTVKIEQDMRDSANWWFYWSFQAQSSRKQTIAFQFMNGEVIGPWGPAVSSDGIEWAWLGKEQVLSPTTFSYSFEASESVYFSFCMPYQPHHFECFYSRVSSHPLVRREVLVVSEQLRPVPILLIGNPDATEHIIFTGRHHACESSASYLVEGLLDTFLQREDCPILRQYLIHYVPFMDMDGVDNGDQGKGRKPHDHNRDYTDAPIYRSTKAIMDRVRSLEPIAGIDFHCPYKWGNRNDFPFIVKKAPPMKQQNERFGQLLEQMTNRHASSDNIIYDPKYDIESGDDWNQPNGSNCSTFFEKQRMELAFTFEFPYFGKQTQFTQSNCRQFGSDFAHALEAYLLERV